MYQMLLKMKIKINLFQRELLFLLYKNWKQSNMRNRYGAKCGVRALEPILIITLSW